MGIRSAAKALIINGDRVLLNKCHDKWNSTYYTLPGGGQNQYETIHDALVRECLEETGYTVIPVRFAALCEEICMHEEFRQRFPDYAHKMHHIFICELANETQKAPTEIDEMQDSCEWVAIASLENLKILPKVLGENIQDVLKGTSPVFLGSEHIEYNHG